MIKVDNKKIVSELAKKDYFQKWKRNVLMVFAIFLTTFMLTVVCTMGISYWNAITSRSVYMQGMKYDIRLPSPTQEQVEKAYQMEEIQYAGVSAACARIEEYNGKACKINLLWSDHINWEQQSIPAFEFAEGTYPAGEKEVMMSVQTLKALGIKEPRIGQELPVRFRSLGQDGETCYTSLTLSGYYRDYSGKSQGYVSKAFYDKTGAVQTDPKLESFLNITLKNPLYTGKEIKRMEKEFQISGRQMLYADYYIIRSVLEYAAGAAGLCLLIMISGYLFIYNILYISISREVRFYGQLKTIGMTGKQTRRLIRLQVWWNGLPGILAGLLSGAAVSRRMVPSLLHLTNPSLNTVPIGNFYPLIYGGAALFSMITIFLSCRKPARIAEHISPMEAVRYVTSNFKTNHKRNINGGRPISMALRNVFRERKQAVVIFASFFVALTTFVTANAITRGHDAKRVLDELNTHDLEVFNIAALSNPGKQVITNSQVEAIRAMTGVASVSKVVSAKIIIPYQEELMGGFLKRVFDNVAVSGTYEEYMKLYQEKPDDPMVIGKIVGVDRDCFELLNENLNQSLNKADFLSGRTGVLQYYLNISVMEAVGKELIYQLPKSQDEEHKIQIVSECRGGGIDMLATGLLPSLVVSEQLVEELFGNTTVELIHVTYEEPYNVGLEEKIKGIFTDKSDIIMESKLSQYEEMKQMEEQITVMGRGLGMILALLAMLNYCNLLITGIQGRRREFAALTSIGMTSGQMRRILVLEGLGYGVISTAAVGILGMPISFLIYQAMNQYGVPYSVSIGENVIVFSVLFIVCMLVPPIAYQFTQKGSIIEQLGDREEL